MNGSSEGSAYPSTCQGFVGCVAAPSTQIARTTHPTDRRSGPAASPASTAVADQALAAARVWAALTPLLAGRPEVRESRNGGRSYRGAWRRSFASHVPGSVPAAVPIYSNAGDTRLLVVDLDVKLGGRVQVLADAAAVRALVARCGGEVFSDESPSGGVHLYIPLARPVAFDAARDVARALASRTPSMDASPMLGLTDGLIRPPGARHRSGGFQVLHGPLDKAVALARAGNPPQVWQRLNAALAVELAALTSTPPLSTDTPIADDAEPAAGAAGVPRRGGPRELAENYLQIAHTGIYDSARYGSPSQARQAVITAAVWAGLTLVDVLARISDGRWRGLASFYARYSNPTSRREALTKFDWPNAVAYVTAQKGKNPGSSLVRQSLTSGSVPHRGVPEQARSNRNTQSEFRFLRTWWSAMAISEQDQHQLGDKPAGWMSRRMLLRALGEAAMKSGSRYVHFGTRSLSIPAGLDQSTVAEHLRRLRDEPDGLVTLLEDSRGGDGDLYELVIPAVLAGRAGRQDWRGGKLHALRPVFLELGIPAALVYEALEHARAPLSSFELITASGLSRSAVYEALETLSAFNLADQRAGRWSVVAATSLTALAEQFGVLETIRKTVQRHRDERAAYRRILQIAEAKPVLTVDPEDWYHWPPPEPPPRNSTVLDLLERILGAYPVPA